MKIACSTALFCLYLSRVASRAFNCTFFSPSNPYPRVLVTGGAGFIGSAFVKKLKIKGYQSVKIVDNFSRSKKSNLIGSNGLYVIDEHHDICIADLTVAHSSRHVFRNVDWVFHLADTVTGKYKVGHDQVGLFHDNMLMNSNVVRAASHHNVTKFVYVGTAGSYPKEVQEVGTLDNPAAVDENQIFPANPESPYGWSKLVGEYEISLIKGMNSNILRLYDVYGPGAEYDMKSAQAVPAIILKAINSLGEKISFSDSGKHYRDFVFVDDVAEALVATMEKNNFVGAVQIGTGVATNLEEVAAIVRNLTSKCLGKNLDVQFDKSNVSGGKVAVINKARKLLSWTPKVSVAHGICMNYAWILRDLASKSSNSTTLLQYASCLDKESEVEQQRGWVPPVRQAKGFKLLVPRPPGDISAVIPHFFCEKERQEIMEEIKKTPPPKKILVVIQSSTRAGHVTFDSFLGNVLERLGADLALAVESQEFATTDAFRNKANYLWELNPPADNNYGHFLNEISTQCFNHTFDKTYASVIGSMMTSKTDSGWLGCIDGTGHGTCAGLIIFYRWFALQNIIKHKLYLKYDTVVMTRSDHLWVAPYDNTTFPVQPGAIYVPHGHDFGGLMDRHYHMSMYDAINTLGMTDLIMERASAEEQKAYLMKYDFDKVGNMERAHLYWHVNIKKMNPIRMDAKSMLVADSSDSALQRWSVPQLMKFHGMYVNVKYPIEYDHLKGIGLL